ncbi:MAG: hypothetical protein ACYTHM_17380, partial [Planctomycetota bacterium]
MRVTVFSIITLAVVTLGISCTKKPADQGPPPAQEKTTSTPKDVPPEKEGKKEEGAPPAETE